MTLMPHPLRSTDIAANTPLLSRTEVLRINLTAVRNERYSSIELSLLSTSFSTHALTLHFFTRILHYFKHFLICLCLSLSCVFLSYLSFIFFLFLSKAS